MSKKTNRKNREINMLLEKGDVVAPIEKGTEEETLFTYIYLVHIYICNLKDRRLAVLLSLLNDKRPLRGTSTI